MKKLISIILTFVIAFTITSCTNSKYTSDGLEKITVVLDWTPNTNHTGLYVAQALGYYEQEGLKVEIVQPPEDGALTLVATNRAQFGISFQDELAVALSGEYPLPVKAVASILQHNDSGILSAKKTCINSPKDMEGKAYASWNSPFEIAVLKSVLASDGGDFNKVNLVPNTVTDAVSAIKTDIDAVWIYYGWDGIASELDGGEFNYFAFKDIDPVLDYYTPVIVSSDSYLTQNTEQAKKFLRATAKGYEYAIENPQESADILISACPELDSELVKKSQVYMASQYKAENENWGEIDLNRWNRFFNWCKQVGIVSENLEGKGLWIDKE
ncbi:MAG: ABC transporter substrate-binding protein [Oscillospiraceae bacterium]|nr:ABC transporter substrate-binding protein [Oscillospiraceae bacterium]